MNHREKEHRKGVVIIMMSSSAKVGVVSMSTWVERSSQRNEINSSGQSVDSDWTDIIAPEKMSVYRGMLPSSGVITRSVRAHDVSLICKLQISLIHQRKTVWGSRSTSTPLLPNHAPRQPPMRRHRSLQTIPIITWATGARGADRRRYTTDPITTTATEAREAIDQSG